MKRNNINKFIALVLIGTITSSILVGCDQTNVDYTIAMNENEEAYQFPKTDTYKNNFELEGEWVEASIADDSGVGDPFVLRHDGKYYMYPSSGAGEGVEKVVKVWESEDLVNWTYKGNAAEGLENTYAPEVIYYNGTFYMTGSPGGNGHYILSSNSPTGPFTPITDNFGKKIDGAFYVDDDGKLYFMYAQSNAVYVADMDTETMLPDTGKMFTATLGKWTEAPGLFRRNGVLFLTYSGNEVHSAAYRVGYSYAMENNPKADFIMPQDNLVLLNVEEGPFKGLGHNSNFIGPNLDSWYTAYHNLVSSLHPFDRAMMIDQFVTNGAMLLANGPTFSEVAVPDRPDFETRNAKAGFISEDKTEDIYTIEYNLIPKDKGVSECIFAYEDDKNFATVRWDMQTESLSLILVKDGKATELQSEIVQGLIADKLHTIRVEKGSDEVLVYIDTMKKISVSANGIEAGNIGVDGDAKYSYLAFENEAFGTSDFETAKNLPSAFPAVHYLKGENRGFSIKNATDVEGGVRQNEPENTNVNEFNQIASLVLDTPNDWVKYAVNVSEESYYGISGTVTAASAGAKIQVIVDESEIYTFTVPEAGIADADFVNMRLGTIPLKTGNHTIKVRLCDGILEVQKFQFETVNPTPITYENALNEINEKGWIYKGEWEILDGATVVQTEDKRSYANVGNEEMMDFTMEVDVGLLEEDGLYDGGILFHTRNLWFMEYDENGRNRPAYTHDVEESFQGYFLSITSGQIALERCNYGTETVCVAEGDFPVGEYKTLKIEMKNHHILVYFDNIDEPVIDYYDYNAFLSGQIALCSFGAKIGFKNIKITN